MNNTKANPLSIVFMLLLIVALVAGMYLVGQKQETRRGAYFAGAKALILPAESTVKVGDDVPVQLWVETEADAKVSAVDAKICYGNGVGLDATDVSSLITLNTDAFKVIEYAKDQDKCLRLVAVSSGIAPENLKTGLVKVASIRFSALKAGDDNFKMDVANVKVTGYNPTVGATDTSMKVSTSTGARYVVSGGVVTGNEPILKFNFSMFGVPTDAKCALAEDMPLSVTVRASNGVSKVYKDVPVQKVTSTSSDKYAVYSVYLPLIGFTEKNNLAVFVKSPKSLQVKYGVDKQTAYYDKAGGELGGLTSNEETTPRFEFTGYPLLAGDVTGAEDKQDGVVDGLDFSFVKTQSIKRTEVGEGEYMLADLNGNCKMESQDLSNLMLSLSVKQGQLY